MNSFVEPLSIQQILEGYAGPDAQYLLRYWRENKGIISRDTTINQISRKLMLFEAVSSPGDVPPATFIGKQSTFRSYLSQSATPHSLPSSYRQKVSYGYEAAVNGEPWYDIQRTGTLMGEGTPDLVLERLILKFRTKSGFERIFCLMMKVDENLRYVQSDQGRRLYHFLPKSSLHQLGLAHHQPI